MAQGCRGWLSNNVRDPSHHSSAPLFLVCRLLYSFLLPHNPKMAAALPATASMFHAGTRRSCKKSEGILAESDILNKLSWRLPHQQFIILVHMITHRFIQEGTWEKAPIWGGKKSGDWSTWNDLAWQGQHWWILTPALFTVATFRKRAHRFSLGKAHRELDLFIL